MTNTIVISINASWNIVNFRSGLIRGLQRAGYRVVAVAPPDEASHRLAELDVEHVPIAIDSKSLSPARDLKLLWEYWRALRRIRPVAYLGYTAKPNVYGSLAAQALGIPVINNVSGLGTAFIRTGLLTWIVSSLYRLAFRRSATVFFQNREDRDLFVGRRLVAAGRAGLLPGSGIDLVRFAPMAVARDPEAPVAFLLVARLLRDKGVVEFVDAARIVRQRHPSVRFRLLGFLDVINRTAISRAEVDGWVAEGLVEYLGAAEDVRPHVAAADCVVLPSYREGLPRSLLEAAAMAKPLIAADVPGCRDIVRPGENGMLCRVRDPASLAACMEAMIALPAEERVAIGARGRALAERKFAEEVVVKRYLEAIEAALGRRCA